MPIAGHVVQTQNFLSLASSKVASIISKRRTHTAPSDGLVLKLHYRWTFWFLAFHFAVAYYNFYSSHLLSCVNKFNGNAPIGEEFINFCTSYIFVKREDSDEKRYLFFYKWLHYVNIILAFFYYMTRKLNKFFEKPIVTKLFEQLHPLRNEYGNKIEKLVLTKVSSYFKEHLRTHNSVFYNALGSNFMALMINVISICFIDFVLQGRFISYGFMTVPFKRDMNNFTDYMSRTFPPFAECTVGKQHEITAGRIQSFGCHLVLMELYEKLFFVLWVWLMLLAVLTVMYIAFLVLFCHPYVRWWALYVQKPDSAGKDISKNEVLGNVLNACRVGDAWLLYKLEKNLSTRLFYMLLCELAQPNLKEITAGDSFLPIEISGPWATLKVPRTPSSSSPLSTRLQKNRMILQKLGLPENFNLEVIRKADKFACITPWSARDTIDPVAA